MDIVMRARILAPGGFEFVTTDTAENIGPWIARTIDNINQLYPNGQASKTHAEVSVYLLRPER